MIYATVNDYVEMYGSLTTEEQEKASKGLEIASAECFEYAKRRGYNLDDMVIDDEALEIILKSVVCDATKRFLDNSTNGAVNTFTQFSESAGGYTTSGTVLNAGGGFLVKRTEFARLGLRKQKLSGFSMI